MSSLSVVSTLSTLSALSISFRRWEAGIPAAPYDESGFQPLTRLERPGPGPMAQAGMNRAVGAWEWRLRWRRDWPLTLFSSGLGDEVVVGVADDFDAGEFGDGELAANVDAAVNVGRVGFAAGDEVTAFQVGEMGVRTAN